MSGSGEAGILLAQAWRELYGMDPDPSEAYRHAVRVGSSVFAQGHLLLGYAVGPAARMFLEDLPLLGIAIIAIVVVGAFAVWIALRGTSAGVRGPERDAAAAAAT